MSDQGNEIIEPGRNLPAMSETRQARNLIFASPDCAEVFGALCDFQGACDPPKKTKTATVKGTSKSGNSFDYSYQYAPLDEIHAVIKVPLAAAGLAHRQFLAERDGQWMMRTIIAHKSGQWMGADYPIFMGQQSGQAQSFASGVTYARRYGLMLALGIVAEDDDDANVADGQPATVSGRPTHAGPAGNGRDATSTASSPGPSGTGRAYQRAQAAPPPSDGEADAVKRLREIEAEIKTSATVPSLETLDGCPAWLAMEKSVRAVKGEAETDIIISALRRKMEIHKRLLLGDEEIPI